MRSRWGRVGSVIRTIACVGATGALAAGFLVTTTGTASAAGNNWYVNPITGNNANTCTSATAPCKTIAAALALASDGDTVNLAPGTYVGSVGVTKAVTIQGAGQGSSIINANETTPSASSTAAVAIDIAATDANTLTIDGVTIEGGISKFGGGIELLSGTLVLNNSTVTANQAGGMTGAVGGGGIGEELTGSGLASSLTLNNDTISNNKGVSVSGAGLYILGPATLSHTTVSGNTASGTTLGGGAFVVDYPGSTTPGTLTAIDSAFTGNSATVGGGIANYSGGHLILTGDGVLPSTVSSNSATDGGGLYDAATASISGTTISHNAASSEGGGFYESEVVSTDVPTITTTNSTFLSNSGAIAGGAGILLAGSTLSSNGDQINQNTAILGAGLYVSAAASTTLTGTIIDGNDAQDGGGLAVAGGGTATLSGVTVSNNVANSGSTANLGLGGGVFDSGNLTIEASSVLNGNQAIADSAAGSVATGWGGAVFAGPSAAGDAPSFTLNDSQVSGGALSSGTNAAIGGGIAVTGNVLGTVAGKTFAASPATFSGTGDAFDGLSALEGGGAYVGGSATFTDSTFSDDTATGSTLSLGGGVLVGKVAAADTPSVTLDSTELSHDSAALGGGVALNSSSTLVTRDDTVFSQDSASNSGGGLYAASTANLANTIFENGTAAEFGGGIFDGSLVAADTPVLTGTDVVVNDNTASLDGAGLAVAANASFNLTQSTIEDNTAPAGGGVLVAAGGTGSLTGSSINGNVANGNDGGAVYNSGILSITSSTVDNNTATPASGSTTTGLGGAIYSGATAALVTTELTLAGDVFTGNTANAASVLVTASSGTGSTNGTSITNSTITANTTAPSYGVIDAFDPVSIAFSTINNNTSPAGASGGLFVEAANAISVAGSDVTTNSVSNCSSPVVDGGYNFTDAASTTKCGFSTAKHDGSGDPGLASLGSNGGPTQTELPAATSPLINQIPVSTPTGLTDAVSGSPIVLCAPGALDQRGDSRPSGPSCDIGAVEVGNSAPTLSGPTAATLLVGVGATPLTFSATGVPTPALSESGALPTGITFVDNGNGTATITGTPAAGSTGTYVIIVTAANGVAPNATQTVTLTIDQAPSISGPTSAAFTVHSPGTVAFSATGTPTPTLSETGALPSGVVFTPGAGGTATLAGTPATGTQGTYHLTITAANGEGTNATLAFTLTVAPPVSITTTTLPAGTVGVAYPTTQLAATNGVKPYSWSVASGSLPAGLNLSSGGSISGTPTGPSGTEGFVVEVTDSANPPGTATANLSITIAKGTTSISVDPVLLAPLPGGGIVYLGSVAATLTGGSPAEPVAGQTIVFSAGSATVCTALTNSSGVARCNISLLSVLAGVLSDGVTATYAGSDSWLPTKATGTVIG